MAAGYCPLALGSQTIGSVIRPAAFCGIVGFKPSYARIDISGFVHCSPSVDTIGMFTQDVAGMEMAAAVLCSGWRASVTRSEKPILGIPVGPYLDQTEPRARVDFDAQVQALRAAGYNVVEVRMFDDIADIDDRHRNMMKGEMAEVHAPWFDKYASTYDAGTRALVEEGRALSQSEIDAGRMGRIELREEVASLMKTEGIDLLACPAATGAALKGLASTGRSLYEFALDAYGYAGDRFARGTRVRFRDAAGDSVYCPRFTAMRSCSPGRYIWSGIFCILVKGAKNESGYSPQATHPCFC